MIIGTGAERNDVDPARLTQDPASASVIWTTLAGVSSVIIDAIRSGGETREEKGDFKE